MEIISNPIYDLLGLGYIFLQAILYIVELLGVPLAADQPLALLAVTIVFGSMAGVLLLRGTFIFNYLLLCAHLILCVSYLSYLLHLSASQDELVVGILFSLITVLLLVFIDSIGLYLIGASIGSFILTALFTPLLGDIGVFVASMIGVGVGLVVAHRLNEPVTEMLNRLTDYTTAGCGVFLLALLVIAFLTVAQVEQFELGAAQCLGVGMLLFLLAAWFASRQQQQRQKRQALEQQNQQQVVTQPKRRKRFSTRYAPVVIGLIVAFFFFNNFPAEARTNIINFSPYLQSLSRFMLNLDEHHAKLLSAAVAEEMLTAVQPIPLYSCPAVTCGTSAVIRAGDRFNLVEPGDGTRPPEWDEVAHLLHVRFVRSRDIPR